MIRILIFFISITALSYAYDFKDSVFNEQLFDEFRDLSSSVSLPARLKRDAVASDGKCGQYKQPNCCKTDKFDVVGAEAFGKVKADCYKDVIGEEVSFFNPFDCESAKQTKENIICVSECASKKFNVMNDNGELERDKLVVHFQRQYAEEPWKLEKVEEMVDKCLPQVKTFAAAENSKCSAEALKMQHCIWKELVQNCPIDEQINSPKCNKIREKITQNDEKFLKSVEYFRFLKMFKRDNTF